jgi:hypothetical protein
MRFPYEMSCFLLVKSIHIFEERLAGRDVHSYSSGSRVGRGFRLVGGCKGMHENEFGRRRVMEYAEKGRLAFKAIVRFSDEILSFFDPYEVSL